MNRLYAAALLLFPALVYALTRRAGEATASDPAAAASLDPFYSGELPPLTLQAPTFLETIGLIDMAATRGERNNNPGNIRISGTPWQGKVQGSDPAFETFADPVLGIRALAKNLKTYQTKYGLNTVRKIITRYAPASENNTDAYVRAVAAAVGVTPDQVINLNDAATLTALVAAIIHHENGRNIYAATDIMNAVGMA